MMQQDWGGRRITTREILNFFKIACICIVSHRTHWKKIRGIKNKTYVLIPTKNC